MKELESTRENTSSCTETAFALAAKEVRGQKSAWAYSPGQTTAEEWTREPHSWPFREKR